MKFYIILIFIYSTVSVGCQNVEQKHSDNEQTNDIVDVSSQIPYAVEGYDPNFTLPESLSNQGKGNAVLDVFLSEKGIVEGFNLTFLKLVNNNSDTLRHYKCANHILQRIEYVNEIQAFLPLFEEYISDLKFVRKKDIPITPNSKYLMKIPLKLE